MEDIQKFLEAQLESQGIEFSHHTMVIKNELYQKIQQHLQSLKLLKGSYSKHRFIHEAIEEKMEVWEKTDKNSLAPDKTLGIRITFSMDEKITQIINERKTLGIRACKKEFFLAAICEKIDRDAANTKKLLLKLIEGSQKKTKEN
jgi:hypothetical protein